MAPMLYSGKMKFMEIKYRVFNKQMSTVQNKSEYLSQNQHQQHKCLVFTFKGQAHTHKKRVEVLGSLQRINPLSQS